MTPEDKAPPKDNVMTECRIAFEKMFSHLDLGSIGGKNYTSKRTNNHWRGFQAAWNIRDVAPDPTPIQSPDQGAVEALRSIRACFESLDTEPDLSCYLDDVLILEQALTRSVRSTTPKSESEIDALQTRPPLDLAETKREILNKMFPNGSKVDDDQYEVGKLLGVIDTLDHLQAIRPDLFGGKE